MHAEKRANNQCSCIGLKELMGPMGEGCEHFLQLLMGCTHPLVVEGNGQLDSPFASLLRGCPVKIFKTA